MAAEYFICMPSCDFKETLVLKNFKNESRKRPDLAEMWLSIWRALFGNLFTD